MMCGPAGSLDGILSGMVLMFSGLGRAFVKCFHHARGHMYSLNGIVAYCLRWRKRDPTPLGKLI